MAAYNTKRVACVNTQCVPDDNSLAGMESPADRLKKARTAAGYAHAVDAARAMDIKPTAYANHENGTRGLAREGVRYARFFRVNLDWLLTGRGEMRRQAAGVPVMGFVAAGAHMSMSGEGAAEGYLDLPEASDVFAVQVRGDSMWPRFMAGEFLLVDARPSSPADLVGRYAVVETEPDGDAYVKIVEPGARPGRYDLVSHNAAPMREIMIRAAAGARRHPGQWRRHAPRRRGGRPVG